MAIVDHSQAPEVPWRPGYRKWDIAGQNQGVTSTLGLDRGEPGAGAPLHTHTVDELMVIIEGTLEVRVGDDTIVVEKDHTLVIPPGLAHGFKVVGDHPAQLLVFFPTLDPYSEEHTHYLEGSRPASVQD